MWTREELKNRAKAAFSNGYWKLVLVGVIANMVGSGGSSNGSDSSEELPSDFVNQLVEVLPLVVAIASVVVLIVVIISIFLLHPLEVGTKRFFVKSLTEDVQIREVVFAFDHNYLNVVKIMFKMYLKIFLWSLLLIIPGIIKSYEYRMVPYLLAENPNISEEEAFRYSKQMMDGQKFETFVLELSFIGWDILSACTLGLVGIFYVQPYTYLTYAALYDTLSTTHGRPGRASTAQQEWSYTYTQTGYEEM